MNMDIMDKDNSDLKKSKQIVILETDEGTAYSEEQLRKVWKERLKKVAPYYKVKEVKISRRKE